MLAYSPAELVATTCLPRLRTSSRAARSPRSALRKELSTARESGIARERDEAVLGESSVAGAISTTPATPSAHRRGGRHRPHPSPRPRRGIAGAVAEAARGVSRELGAGRWPAPPIVVARPRGSDPLSGFDSRGLNPRYAARSERGRGMSENLARILTETAETSGDQTAFKLDDVELNYAMLDEGSARVAGLLKAKGVRARRPRRGHAPERPVLPGRLLRHPARGRRGGADERAAQGARGRVLPRGLRARRSLFAWHDFAEAAEAGAERGRRRGASWSSRASSSELLGRAASRTARWPSATPTTPR